MSEAVNYVQTVRQTFAERVKMYRKLTKQELVSMYNERLRVRGEKDPMAKTYTKVWLANWLAEDEKTHYPDGCAECEPETKEYMGVTFSSASTEEPIDVIGDFDVEEDGDAIDYIATERWEQVHKHGYTPENDAGYKNKELLFGALAYLNSDIYNGNIGSEDWPFKKDTFKPSGDPIVNLTKAAAMIAAEIDRIRYIQKQKEK